MPYFEEYHILNTVYYSSLAGETCDVVPAYNFESTSYWYCIRMFHLEEYRILSTVCCSFFGTLYFEILIYGYRNFSTEYISFDGRRDL
jgi:hypothetical protein